VIVGGAAVEFYTGGAVATGDFDIVAAADNELEQSLLEQGFLRPRARGALMRGFIHPDLAFGVELVSGALFDGRADRGRLWEVEIGDGHVLFAAPEDLIADRLAQYLSSPAGVPEMLLQAAIDLAACSALDNDYLDKRIGMETSHELSLNAFLGLLNEADYTKGASLAPGKTKG
jgi:hypothetical protein